MQMHRRDRSTRIFTRIRPVRNHERFADDHSSKPIGQTTDVRASVRHTGRGRAHVRAPAIGFLKWPRLIGFGTPCRTKRLRSRRSTAARPMCGTRTACACGLPRCHSTTPSSHCGRASPSGSGRQGTTSWILGRAPDPGTVVRARRSVRRTEFDEAWDRPVARRGRCRSGRGRGRELGHCDCEPARGRLLSAAWLSNHRRSLDSFRPRSSNDSRPLTCLMEPTGLGRHSGTLIWSAGCQLGRGRWPRWFCGVGFGGGSASAVVDVCVATHMRGLVPHDRVCEMRSGAVLWRRAWPVRAAHSVPSGRSSRRCAGALSSPSRCVVAATPSSRAPSSVRRARARRRPRRSSAACLGPRARSSVRAACGRSSPLGLARRGTCRCVCVPA